MPSDLPNILPFDSDPDHHYRTVFALVYQPGASGTKKRRATPCPARAVTRNPM